jgi:hypothetical protein
MTHDVYLYGMVSSSTVYPGRQARVLAEVRIEADDRRGCHVFYEVLVFIAEQKGRQPG